MKRDKESRDPIWIYPKDSPDRTAAIVKEFDIHHTTAQILLSRGLTSFEEIHHYLYAKLPDLFSPKLFLDMDKAVARILRAQQRGEHILVYGDNDVDGITGTALLSEFLQSIDGNVHYYIPNRITANPLPITDAFDFAKQHHCTLIITVDCGITATREIQELTQKTIDVIITDHHEPTHSTPHCLANLNPKLTDSTYPNRDLTGVGVAFKLVHAVTNALVARKQISQSEIDLKNSLDLVALGTISDMGVLMGENRILVRYGLRQFSKTKRIGLVKLMEICAIDPDKINANNIASKIAPRLNSLGRIDNPNKGVDLLLTQDREKASQLAQELEKKNSERQQIEKSDLDDITTYLASHPEALKDKVIVLHSKKWHPGTIPIIATRISKRYNRPTLIITIEGGVRKGSMRTIPEFPLFIPLHRLADLLLSFGGHDYAAGFLIEENKIPQFQATFTEIANNMLKNEDIIPKIRLDAEIQFEDLTFDFLESLQLLEPYGTGNPPPLFYTDVQQCRPPKMINNLHLKFYLEQNHRTLEGIGLRMGEQRDALHKKNAKLQIAFTPRINQFFKQESIQLLIHHIKIKS